ncbi:MAG: DUF1579 family protein [Planctomycetota bacterium]
MRNTAFLPGLLCGALAASLLAPAFPQDAAPEGGDVDLAAMMEKARRFTEPGESHAFLARFVGTWETETTFPGMGMPAEKGTSTCSWLMDGRWLQMRGEGRMLGRETESYYLFGYDNFKQSFVTTAVSSLDTAMTHAEGDLTRDRKALITYGTLDEYLTGEHDKMVKSVWRFPDDDHIVLEIHDLPIGETGTQVVEVRFTRKG